jgi:hypothetical protein
MPNRPSTAREQSKAMAMAALKPHLSKLAPDQSQSVLSELFLHPAEMGGAQARAGAQPAKANAL